MDISNDDTLHETLKDEAAEAQAIHIIEEDRTFLSENNHPFFSEFDQMDIIRIKLGKDKEDELSIRKWLFSQLRGKNKKHKGKVTKVLKDVYNLKVLSKKEYLELKKEEDKSNADPRIQMQEMRSQI